MSTILECKNLSKKYGRKQALDNITLSLESGRIIGLLGPNGSGKTTLIKLINGLLAPTGGKLFINGNTPGVESKKIVSYLPERTYLDETQKVSEAITLFEDFYEDFDRSRAISMLEKLNIDSNARIKTLSKGTKEKVQLILVMSRRAKLYCLDEPIAGVDPAARDYILSTIINNYEPDSTILISTHLISDVENILDEVVFIKNGHIVLKNDVEDIRFNQGKSVDVLFREVFPERTYLDETQKVSEAITLFEDFYEDFDRSRAISMLEKLNIDSNARIKTLSKGTKEKVQLILVMSRRAKLYCLDEPIAGVDPAARDYILSTIINNYEPDSTILISTHLISDVENILDEVVFIKNGHIVLKNDVEDIRFNQGKSVDVLFREVFKC